MRGLPPIPPRNADGSRPCRGCGAVVPKGRKTWCSLACREKHYTALSSHARRLLLQRDHGVCALCGYDYGLVKRIMSRLYWLDRETWFLVHHRKLWTVVPWEADHIVPLSEGGTNDLSNYRTLCRPCHRAETAALRARLAAKRRAAPEVKP